ncbi:MAG: N-acetyltransferase [Thermoleophilia bacterium]
MIEEVPLGDARLDEFVRLPWRLYRGDPFWTPPLRGDLLGSRLLGLKGLLTSAHAYHDDAEVTHFLARRAGEVVGRVSAAINHRFNEYYHCRIGFFGFLETIDDAEVAGALLDAARAWVADRGMTAIRGPGEYSNVTHERQGILIDGFDTPPVVEQTHNPPYYADLLEGYGFRKVMDYHAYMVGVNDPAPDRLEEVARRAAARRDLTLRTISRKDLEADIRLVVELYNEAWADNWGFLPITPGEADSLADTLRPILDEGTVRFAYVDGEPAAVFGAFPDPNYALRPRWKWYGDSDAVRVARLLLVRRRIPRVRLMFFGVRPQFRRLGIDALLYLETKKYGMTKGYVDCDISLLLENNHMVLRAAEFMGAHRYKTWRIYELPLGATGVASGEVAAAGE